MPLLPCSLLKLCGCAPPPILPHTLASRPKGRRPIQSTPTEGYVRYRLGLESAVVGKKASLLLVGQVVESCPAACQGPELGQGACSERQEVLHAVGRARRR